MWQTPDKIIKNTTTFLGLFKSYPLPLLATWNEPVRKWAVAVPNTGLYHGEFNDTYFETEYFDDDDLMLWLDIACIQNKLF